MLIGQIEQMKIDQVDAGLVDLNTSRQIGSRASGDTDFSKLMMDPEHAGQKFETADPETQGDANQRS